MAAALMRALAGAGAALYGAAWEAKRRAYARGWARPHAVASRVVSIGNLTLGGTGKTTLVLHLVALARARGVRATVVARNYRPGPAGAGDEGLLYQRAFGRNEVFVGNRKRSLAGLAADRGYALIVVDDGFSTWNLARDLDIVLLDSQDMWGGARLLPAGRLREPRRALQRADVVVVTRLAPGEDPGPCLADAKRYAPAASFAGARHRVTGARRMDGTPLAEGERVWLVTATGNPAAVERTAREAGLAVVGRSVFRDHHWWGAVELARERERAARERAVLLLTAKDAVRWPATLKADGAARLEVAWEWVCGGAEVEARILEGVMPA